MWKRIIRIKSEEIKDGQWKGEREKLEELKKINANMGQKAGEGIQDKSLSTQKLWERKSKLKTYENKSQFF